MSTKTLPGGPSGESLYLFLLISVAIHLAAALAFYALTPVSGWLSGAMERVSKRPILVDVIELPPGPAARSAPERPTHYAQRHSVAEKETYPEDAIKSQAARAPRAAVAQGGAEGAREDGSVRQEARPGQVKDSGPQARKAETPRVEAMPAKEAAGPAEDPAASAPMAEPKAGAEDKPAPQASSMAAEKRKRPDLLLSDERISELTKRYEAEAPKGERGKTLALNTSELRYQKYIINMKNRIESRWEYPYLAVKNGWHGKLRIDFTIRKDGTIKDIKLVKSSNYPVLDDAAITALRLSSPFPPFPEDFQIEEFTINGNFEYIFIRDAGGGA